MKLTEGFFKTFKEKPKDADNISAALLNKAGFIDKEASGVYSLLPLGWKVCQKICQIVRQEMDKIGGQEIQMPTLQPKELWLETGRWDKMDPPLFVTKDRHQKELALGSTHEEVVVDLVRDRISSFRELPFMVYQIQNKFRNEQRSTGGLLRVREFLMKDAYSFHASEEDFQKYYQKVIKAYQKIYQGCGLAAKMVEAHSGSIGGEKSNEFMILAENGENEIFLCSVCDWAANAEMVENPEKCPSCGGEIKKANAIEVGHIFMLGDLYSKKMKANFVDQDGQQKPMIMGCYGIGIGRLLATIAEVFNDEKGLIWPKSVAPYDIHLISLDQNDKADQTYQSLLEGGFEVLYDDRQETAGVKFADADLVGIPVRITVSEKTLKDDSVEVKKRKSDKTEMVKIKNLVDQLK